jgi:hypothetical protein
VVPLYSDFTRQPKWRLVAAEAGASHTQAVAVVADLLAAANRSSRGDRLPTSWERARRPAGPPAPTSSRTSAISVNGANRVIRPTRTTQLACRLADELAAYIEEHEMMRTEKRCLSPPSRSPIGQPRTMRRRSWPRAPLTAPTRAGFGGNGGGVCVLGEPSPDRRARWGFFSSARPCPTPARNQRLFCRFDSAPDLHGPPCRRSGIAQLA